MNITTSALPSNPEQALAQEQFFEEHVSNAVWDAFMQRTGSLLLCFGTPRAVSRVTEKVPSTSRHCRTSILETCTASLTLTDDLFLLLTTYGVVNE